jgi:hypothetical protein
VNYAEQVGDSTLAMQRYFSSPALTSRDTSVCGTPMEPTGLILGLIFLQHHETRPTHDDTIPIHDGR